MSACLALTGALLGAFVMKRHHRRWHHRHGGGPFGRWHHHAWDHDHRFGGDSERGPWSRRGARRRVLGWALERLELDPAQEKRVLEEVEGLERSLEAIRGEGAATRADLARAIRGEAFDETALGEMYARQDERLGAARDAVSGALGRVHAVLDDEQRERLADVIGGGRRGGPFR